MRKPELVELLHAYLTAEHNLRDLLSRLNERQQAAVAEATHAEDGEFPQAIFAAKYGGQPEWGRLHLFFYSNTIPSDLRARLRRLVPPPAPAVLVSSADLPEATAEDATVRPTETAAAADLMAVLRLCDLGRIRCSEKTGKPSETSQRAVEEVLRDGDFYADPPIVAFAWPLLLRAGGLAELAGGRLQLTARGRAATGHPAPETLRHLWRRWLAHGVIDEFSRVEGIKGQQANSGRNLTAVPPRRQVVATALAACRTGEWVTVDEFWRYMRTERHTFDVARNVWKLYVGDPIYGGLEDGNSLWPLIQGRYVLCLLFEYAATLGLVDVAYGDPEGARDDFDHLRGSDALEALSRYDGLRAFRLTGIGAYCLGLTDTYVAPAATAPGTLAGGDAPRLRVLPIGDVVALGPPLHAGNRLLLEAYAEPRSAGTWALRRAGLLAAAGAGHPVAELRDFLQARAEGGIPASVDALLREAEGRAGALRDTGVWRVLECPDPNLALLITHDRRLRDLCALGGEGHVLVRPEKEAAFTRALHQLGYGWVTEGAAGGGEPAGPVQRNGTRR